MADQRSTDLGGVEGKLKNLKLSEAEKKSIKIGRKQACAQSSGKLQAVGKILSERPARAEYVKKTLGAIWNPISGIECRDKGRNRFLFSFYDEVSKKKAVQNGPWDFNGSLIVMENFQPNKTIDEYDFKTIPIWVRAYGIPMGMMNQDTGRLVGEQIGEYLDVDLDEDGEARGEFLRVKVRLDITVPLMRFTTLEIEDEDEEGNQIGSGNTEGIEEKIVTLKYEHLPDLCYKCGIIGHTEKVCPNSEGSDGRRQYGPWLRAIIIKNSPRESKGGSSSDRGNFWLTNSLGSDGSKQGSDNPLWRKDTSSNVKEGITEGMSPKETVEGKEKKEKLLLCEAKSEMIKSKDIEKEKSEEAKKERKKYIDQGSRYDRSKEEKIHKTFRRSNRARVIDQKKHDEGKEQETKKRNAELMEIDDELGVIKKAKMDVDKEAQLEEGSTYLNTESEIAGLQGQPGGAQ